MHSFKEMDPQRIRELLDSKDENGNKLYPDVLTPLAAREQELFQSSSCPKCGAHSASTMVNANRPFAPSSPLPNKILRCVVCQTEFDPKTGLVTLATIVSGV